MSVCLSAPGGTLRAASLDVDNGQSAEEYSRPRHTHVVRQVLTDVASKRGAVKLKVSDAARALSSALLVLKAEPRACCPGNKEVQRIRLIEAGDKE
jgi:hypothetical protein